MRWPIFKVACSAALTASSVAALDPIEVLGNKFFNKDGSQFFLKGAS
jgi:1,3-beta-glucanosyltransferase GAS1